MGYISPIIAAGVTLAALGGRLYNKYRYRKKMSEAHDSLMKSNEELSKFGLGKPSYYIRNKLKDLIGVEVPVVNVTDPNVSRSLGVDNNAFFIQPKYAEHIAKLVKAPDSYKQHGMVVLGNGDRFSDTVTLAHELGHARDFKEGKIADYGANRLINILGLLGSIGLYAGIRKNDLGIGNGTLRGAVKTAVSLLPGLATTYWIHRRRLGNETRASEHAKKALSQLKGKMRTEGAYEQLSKDLDSAFDTYDTHAKYDTIDSLLKAVATAGVSGAVSGVGGLIKAL